MSKGLVVSAVEENSIAAEMEIEPGDIILQIDGYTINDILDFQYYISDQEFTMLVEKNKHNEIWELKIEKLPGESLGIQVCTVSSEGLKKCRNNCVFCFVQQMPPGMRESLYDRDDDYRLSVTQGSYITLSNLSEEDFERIIRLHISPLYISVHAWDPQVRKRLMKNRATGELPHQIKRLAAAGLTLHTQVVLVPGYNDGDMLTETVENLAFFYPSVQSIGIVPVGLTKYREGLPKLRTVTAEEAKKLLETGLEWQKKFRQKTGKNLVYFSDEFYVLAQKDFPPAEEYDGFPQLENGIGMASKLNAELEGLWPKIPAKIPPRKIHIVTGVLAGAFFRSLKDKLRFVEGLTVIVHEIINNFFGPTVTVAGLLTARDIAEQLGNLDGDYFLIPRVMLKEDEDIFLDDYNISWLEEKVNGKAVVVENNARALLEGILGKRLEV